MPTDMSKYPKNWKTEIRPMILERAGHKCEFCGLDNYALIMRHPEYDEQHLLYDVENDTHYDETGWAVRMSEMSEAYIDVPYIKVILTIAHIHDPDPMNCDPDNLKALCQRCHNRHDMPMRVENRRKTRLKKKREEIRATGQMEMFG